MSNKIYKYARCNPINSNIDRQSNSIINIYKNNSKEKGIESYLKLCKKNKYMEKFCDSFNNKKIDIDFKIKSSNQNEIFVYELISTLSLFYNEKKDFLNSNLLDIIHIVSEEQTKMLKKYNDKSFFVEYIKSCPVELKNISYFICTSIDYYNQTRNSMLLEYSFTYANMLIEIFNKFNLIDDSYLKEVDNSSFIRLYNITNDKKYLEFSEKILEINRYKDFQTNSGNVINAMNLNNCAINTYLENGNEELLRVCDKMWDDIILKRMYITGGIGSHFDGECFGSRYNLPNQRAFAQTKAGVLNFKYAFKMLLAKENSTYADYMEQILYNAILVGYGISGDNYFDINPLKYDPYDIHLKEQRFLPIKYSYEQMHGDINDEIYKENTARLLWNENSLSPLAIHSLLATVENYIYTYSEQELGVQLYIPSNIKINDNITLSMKTSYPFDEKIQINFQGSGKLKLKLRIPAWTQNYTISINNSIVSDCVVENGYAVIDRVWNNGDNITLNISIESQLVIGHPYSQNNSSCAFMRGPIVYCLEEKDNIDYDIFSLRINPTTELSEEKINISGISIVSIITNCEVVVQNKWENNAYILSEQAFNYKLAHLRAIPYFLWSNRNLGKMCVWIPFSM